MSASGQHEEDMRPTYAAAAGGASVREARRALRSLTHPSLAAELVSASDGGRPLELSSAEPTAPRLEAATPIEGDSFRARRPEGEPVEGFTAFLDGIQATRVLGHWTDGVPVVHGTAAAVVRVRRLRRLTTWRGNPMVVRALHVPVALAGAARVAALRATAVEVIDTLQGDSSVDSRHPHELLGLARTSVQRGREALEISLAEAWCTAPDAPLYVDGGIAGAGLAARSAHAIGVVKSHRTLYASPDGVGVVTALAEGERTTAFAVSSPRRTAVASWYLRLRAPLGHDPFFGLVRVEAALDSFDSARADLVSRWVLAERVPLSFPDPRWSTLAYGIRDCEEYLRSVTGRTRAGGRADRW